MNDEPLEFVRRCPLAEMLLPDVLGSRAERMELDILLRLNPVAEVSELARMAYFLVLTRRERWLAAMGQLEP